MRPLKQEFKIVKLNFDDIDLSFKKQWSRLISRSLDPVVYLDPNFVLSAEENLRRQNLIIRAVYRTDLEKPLLIGLGLFTFRFGDLRLPFPHLQVYKTEHSFLTGIILDPEYVEISFELILGSLARQYWYIAGIRFVDFPIEDSLAEKILTANKVNWFQFWTYQRAIYKLPEQQDDSWSAEISKKRLKNYRKARRELEAIGNLEWRYIANEDIDQTVIDEFLITEHSGWKGEEGTSLLSNENGQNFFNSLINRLKKENQVFFTELRLNDKIIAGTCNLLLKDKAFAFKIGWDIEYKKYSPGVINEIEFLQFADKEKCPFSIIESGATEGSFIDDYWKKRWLLAEGVLSIHPFSKLVNSLNNKARFAVKHLLHKIKNRNA